MSTWTEETAVGKVLRQTKKLRKATGLFLIGIAPGWSTAYLVLGVELRTKGKVLTL